MKNNLTIVTHPNDILRQKSRDIDIKILAKQTFQKLLANMTEAMLKKDGIGLAAPQIGKNIRLIIVNTKDGPEVFINPKLSKKSILKEVGEEGCLSVPGYFGKVKRHKKVVCDYVNDKGQNKKIEANGLMARVLQHEVDHLDGVLFIDREIK